MHSSALARLQTETLGMLVDPVEKFMSTDNDAAQNDRDAAVPAEVRGAPVRCVAISARLRHPARRRSRRG